MGNEIHPLLKGGRRETKYSHGFSSSDMETLASICEVLIPPLTLNSLDDMGISGQAKEKVQSFLEASGSQNLVPDEVRNSIILLSLSLALSLNMCVCACVYILVYVYIQAEAITLLYNICNRLLKF